MNISRRIYVAIMTVFICLFLSIGSNADSDVPSSLNTANQSTSIDNGKFLPPPVDRDYDLDVTVNFDLDGKPYSVHRLVAFHRPKSPLPCNGCNVPTPEYSAFGLKSPSGEDIVIWLPLALGSHSIEDYNLAGAVGAGEIPRIGLLKESAKPEELDIYASYRAYMSPGARVHLKSIMEKVVPAGPGDKPDSFAQFGKTYGVWNQVSFLVIPKAIWDAANSGLVSKELRAVLESAGQPLMLNNPDTSRSGEFDKAQAYDSSKGDNFTCISNILKITPYAPGQTIDYFSLLLPYRLNDGVWKPIPKATGRLILFLSANGYPADQAGEALDLPAWRIWEKLTRERKFDVNGSLLSYRYVPMMNNELLPCGLYIPARQSIYVPVHQQL